MKSSCIPQEADSFLTIVNRNKFTDMIQKNLKWLLPIIVLFITNVIYFYPAFQGKKLMQDDIILGQAKGKSIVDYREATGEEPLWTNSMFSGMPTFQISTKYPNNWISYAQEVISTVLIQNSSIYMIASIMLGMFFLLRSYKVDPWLSVIGAIAIGFSAFFIISMAAGHNAKVRTAAYIAPTLIGVLLTLNGRQILGFAVTALGLGLSINSNHFQITFYTGLIILCILAVYAIQAVRTKELTAFIRRAAVLAAAAVLGVGPNIGNLWSTLSYTQETMRGGHTALVENNPSESDGNSTSSGLSFDYAMGWSMTKAETFNLFIPMFAGGGAMESYESTDLYQQIARPGANAAQKEQINRAIGSTMYWGESMTNGSYYIGATVFFLFVLALFTVKGATRQWVVASIVLALFLGWGKHLSWFNEFIFNNFPLYNKFRVPSMSVVILCVVIPFYGLVGLSEWMKQKKEDVALAKKNLMTSFYIGGGLALAIALIGPALFSMEGANDARMLGFWQQNGLQLSIDDLIDERGALMRTSAFKSFLFMASVFGVLFLYLRNTLQLKYATIALLSLVVLDLWSFDKDQLNEDSFVEDRNYLADYNPTSADQLILKDNDPHFRVWNTGAGLTSDSRTSFYHKSIGGYHGAKLARYQDLIDNQLSQGNLPAFNMLNAKWFIVQGQNNQPTAQVNINAAGNAWFPEEVIWANGPMEEMEALTDFNASLQVVVDESLRGQVEGAIRSDSTFLNEIQLTSYDPKEMTYEAVVEKNPALVVFSEIWYDAPNQEWKLYSGDTEIEMIRVNYTLRAAVLPAGRHELTMRFEPKTYYMGEKIDLVFSILLLLSIAGAVFVEWKKRGHSAAETSEE